MTLSEAMDRVRVADASWQSALRDSRNAPPNADFTQRLRQIANSARLMHQALAAAADEGLGKQSDRLRTFPHELTADAFRPGPAELWSEWDAAVRIWQNAAQGTSLRALADALLPIGTIGDRLADAIEAETQPSREQPERRSREAS